MRAIVDDLQLSEVHLASKNSRFPRSTENREIRNSPVSFRIARFVLAREKIEG